MQGLKSMHPAFRQLSMHATALGSHCHGNDKKSGNNGASKKTAPPSRPTPTPVMPAP